MAISRVTGSDSSHPSGGAVTSISTTWAQTTTAGNLLIMLVTWNIVTDPSTITDPAGWTLAGTEFVGSTKVKGRLYYIANASAHSGAEAGPSWLVATNAEMMLFEYAGAATSTPFEGAGTAATANSSAIASGSITTANANDLIVAAYAQQNNDTFSLPTNSFAIAKQEASGAAASTRVTGALLELVTTTTLTTSSGATSSGVNQWVAQTFAFKAAGGAVPAGGTATLTESGAQVVGTVLHGSTSGWSNTPTSYSFAWKRDGSTITTDSGAGTTDTYTLVSADDGHTISLVVTATNGSGNSTGATASNTVSAGTVPANTVAPGVTPTGNQLVGQALTTTNGTWTGTATITFTYQWKRDASNIAAATASSYTLVSADDGHAITCVVTGTNTWGNSTGTSNTVSAGTAPANAGGAALPAISGTAQVGATLTTTDGTWTGTATITFAYQWKSAAANVGTNQNTYIPVVGDVGNTITCVVTATNSWGNASATSPATSAVIAAAIGNVAPFLPVIRRRRRLILTGSH